MRKMTQRARRGKRSWKITPWLCVWLLRAQHRHPDTRLSVTHVVLPEVYEDTSQHRLLVLLLAGGLSAQYHSLCSTDGDTHQGLCHFRGHSFVLKFVTGVTDKERKNCAAHKDPKLLPTSKYHSWPPLLTYDSIPKGNSWLMAIVALKVFLLSLQTSSLPR